MNNQLTKVSRCAALLICWVLSSHTVYADHGSGGAVSVSLNSSNSALTLKKGQWLIQSLSEFRTYKSFSSSDLIGIGMGDYTIVEKQRLMFGALNVTYGLMNRFSLSVQQAYYMSVVDIIGDNIIMEILIVEVLFIFVRCSESELGLLRRALYNSECHVTERGRPDTSAEPTRDSGAAENKKQE